ncbi:MAG: septum formation protein Maf [Bdellovibrionaceae bacterium]|nr:septum formation protein Maf [Pseudobdellovibrionaceae bacterium]
MINIVTTPPLILASTSPYRKALLERLGFDFATRKPPYDEEKLKGLGLAPRELARQLAAGKAESARHSPDEVLIGSDQLGALETAPGQFEILGKPGDREKNIAQLMRLGGRSHSLFTAVCVLYRDQRFEFMDETRITFRPLTEAEVTAVVDRDHPWDCAGGYKFEKAGITLIEKLECADPTAIEGLPLIQLSTVLRGLGYL